jgi:hypothetical protein
MGGSRLLVTALALAAACSSGAPLPARTAAPSPSAGPSATTSAPSTTGPSGSPVLAVAHPTTWLCAPGLPANPCVGGLDSTSVDAHGVTTRVPYVPAVDPPVDCFYVYPTVSEAKTVNAPLRATAAEVRTVRAQAARFGSVCRVFAPVYRQLTVNALITGRFGDRAGRELAHADVVSAWHDYLGHHPGRRFVLIGHSQGTFELLRLMQEEIDGNPALHGRLVSALLLGGNLKVPPGRDVGGDLQNIPLCRTSTQHGCVVAYNSYDQTPPADALFGRPDLARHLVAACTNPAALAGGSAVLHPELPTPHLSPGSPAAPGTAAYLTGFVTFPGYAWAQCRTHDGAAWLEISLRRIPRDTRPQLPLTLGPSWGLHLVDVNVALDDLVSLVRQQS